MAQRVLNAQTYGLPATATSTVLVAMASRGGQLEAPRMHHRAEVRSRLCDRSADVMWACAAAAALGRHQLDGLAVHVPFDILANESRRLRCRWRSGGQSASPACGTVATVGDAGQGQVMRVVCLLQGME